MKTKFSLILFGLALSFFLIEGGLRLAGSIYVLAHDKSYFYQGLETEPWDRDETFEVYDRNTSKLILTIGDSFTNGGNVQSHQSYPSQLFEIEKNSSVVNLGRCESSTYSAFLRLKKYYDTNDDHPEFVTVLVGAADGFVKAPENESSDSFIRISNSSWLYDLRIYKLYRYISLGLKRKRIIGNVGKAWDIEKEISETNKVYNIMREAYLKNDDLDKSWASAHRLLSLDFLNYCERNKIYVDNPRGLLHASLVYLVKLYASRGKHSKALELLLEFQEMQPKLFWSEFFQPARFFFYQIFQIQSKFDSKVVLDNFNKQLKTEPSISNSSHFRHMVERFKNWDDEENAISNSRQKYLRKMVELTRRYGTKIVFMTYPSDYKAANEDILEAATKYHVPLVDLNRFFDKNSKEFGRTKFFEDDDHLTPQGYQLMAAEVSRSLK